MISKTIYERIYAELNSLIGDLPAFLHGETDHIKLESPGFMDLHIDRLSNNCLALAHNFIQNEDVMADPDVEIRIHEENRSAEALSFQQDSMGVYIVVYPQPGRVNIKAKKDINEFLLNWLHNLWEQGFFPPRCEANV